MKGESIQNQAGGEEWVSEGTVGVYNDALWSGGAVVLLKNMVQFLVVL